MINRSNHPLEWALFISELEDAQEHLRSLLQELETEEAVDTPSFAIDLGHICSHLNRAWRRHDHVGDLSEIEWHEASAFPEDLKPI